MTIVLIAVVIGSIIKAVTGMGLPVIVIPTAALFVDLDDAIVVMAVPTLLANGTLVWTERHRLPETRDLPALVAFGVVGAAAGAFAFVYVAEPVLVAALLVAVGTYIAVFFAKPDLKTTAATSKRWSPVVGFVAGGFQGALGISGPIIGSWIHSYRLSRGAHILSVTLLFFATGIAQFAVLVSHDEFDGRVIASLAACVPVLLSLPIGRRLRNHVSPRSFDLAIVTVLAASSLALAVRTFA